MTRVGRTVSSFFDEVMKDGGYTFADFARYGGLVQAFAATPERLLTLFTLD